jgi:hypothetical protein
MRTISFFSNETGNTEALNSNPAIAGLSILLRNIRVQHFSNTFAECVRKDEDIKKF